MRLLTGHSPEQIGGAFNCPASSLNAHPLSVVLVQRGREPQPSPVYIYKSELVFAYLMQMKWRVFFCFVYFYENGEGERKEKQILKCNTNALQRQKKRTIKQNGGVRVRRWLMDEIDDGWARRTTCPTPPLFFLLVRRAPFLPAHVLSIN